MYCEIFLSGGSLKPGESVVLWAVLDSRYLTLRENKQNSEARLTLSCLFTLQSVRIEILFIYKTWINEYILITLCIKKTPTLWAKLHFRFFCVQRPLSFIALGFELKGKQPIFLVLCIFKILKITPMNSIIITIIICVWWGEVVCMCV